MRVAALFSGGKDSTYALHLLQQRGWTVERLLTVVPESPESYMYHYPNVEWTRLQAEAMGIPQRSAGSRCEKEAELADLEELMRDEETGGFVSGAIASDYQWSRLNGICHRLGRPLFSPLRRKSQHLLMEDMLSAGFRMVITGVYAHGFDESWLGLEVDHEVLERLLGLERRYGVSVSGEGGEIETFVVDGPCFSRAIEIREASTEWARDSGTYRIAEAALVDRV
jgi:diphthine-ammonia ligase